MHFPQNLVWTQFMPYNVRSQIVFKNFTSFVKLWTLWCVWFFKTPNQTQRFLVISSSFVLFYWFLHKWWILKVVVFSPVMSNWPQISWACTTLHTRFNENIFMTKCHLVKAQLAVWCVWRLRNHEAREILMFPTSNTSNRAS